MQFFFDMLLISCSTAIFLRSANLFTKYQSKSLSDVCIVLLYLFQVIPVICDYLFGLPEYTKWFVGFEEALRSAHTNIIYDVYVLLLFVSLFVVSLRSQKKMFVERYITELKGMSFSNLFLIIMTALPFIHFLVFGNLSSLLMYGTNLSRGLGSSFTSINANLQIVAIVSLSVLYFKSSPSVFKTLLFFIVFFAISYLNGKRYMLAMSMFAFLYTYAIERRFSSNKLNMKVLVPVALLLFSSFFVFYMVNVKLTSDGSFDATYRSMRIDFGRDDVVKYTIKKELIDGEPILEYPGETFVSTLGMIIPRSIWSSKPYPHYRYLTASLYGVKTEDIPAGMTPSILEMFVSNFGWIGIPLCIIFLCWFCIKADGATGLLTKLLYAFVLIGMLTQSLDSLLIVFYLLLLIGFKDFLKSNGVLDKYKTI